MVDLAEHPGGEAPVDLLDGVRRHRLDEPQLAAARDERDDLEQAPGLVSQRFRAREHGVAHGLRQLDRPKGEDLRLVSPVAARQGVDGIAVGADRRGERAHRLDGEPRHVHS